jgi:LacI family transcriptional regulator
VDGFLVVPASYQRLWTLHKQRVPYVVLDRRVPGESVDSVRSDSVGGAYGLTKHLIELGHRRIAIVTGQQDNSTAYDRLVGYRQSLFEAGLGSEEQVYWGDYNQQSGYDCARQALQQEPRPTAIFATNNFIAIGVMRALREADVRVPQDMSVVAFDDLPLAITIDPFFTVAAQPAYEMGQRATQLLLSRLTNDNTSAHQEIILPIEIIVRKSSGKPPGHE